MVLSHTTRGSTSASGKCGNMHNVAAKTATGNPETNITLHLLKPGWLEYERSGFLFWGVGFGLFSGANPTLRVYSCDKLIKWGPRCRLWDPVVNKKQCAPKMTAMFEAEDTFSKAFLFFGIYVRFQGRNRSSNI